MFSKAKYFIFGLVGVFVIYTLMNDQSGGVTRADLDQVLNVASSSLDSMEDDTGVTKDNAMDKFAATYSQDLNRSEPALHSGAVGVVSNSDGSFDGFADDNNNAQKDEGEKDLFKLEIDSENSKLIASDETAVRDQGFSGSGLIAGMLIGSMLSRQRSAGRTPAGGRATTSKAAYKKSTSARSRAGSGSHSRGK
jgi:hypothetical protein